MPSVEDVAQNVDMAFGPLLHGAAAICRPVHGTVGVDEIVTEAHLRWNEATNRVLGICRKHIGGWVQSIDLYEDIEVLVEEMRRKVIHHAVEATVCAVILLSPDTQLGSAWPIAVSGTCKAEKVPEHRRLLQTVLDGIAAAKALQGICIICYASDGASMHHKALRDMTAKHQLSRESNIFLHLGHLPLLDLWVSDNDLTVDKDYKHVAFKWFSPCTNVPLICKLCGPEKPAVWWYNYHHHLRTTHSLTHLEEFCAGFEVSDVEHQAMGLIWNRICSRMAPRLKKDSRPSKLTVSHSHSLSATLHRFDNGSTHEYNRFDNGSTHESDDQVHAAGDRTTCGSDLDANNIADTPQGDDLDNNNFAHNVAPQPCPCLRP
ncbi:hypothetical protein K488DRAFT_91354 [Vararia minispora EC-137]|uniref:Uncharacterized protein n=1 Tax=Vararia minispora EC-137 TaxID=1314806 RepID=A0ACB8Q642_9AGAM|nr:hypothetical protein K488DRAFT_91354 [Vararia minispora EC-137]